MNPPTKPSGWSLKLGMADLQLLVEVRGPELIGRMHLRPLPTPFPPLGGGRQCPIGDINGNWTATQEQPLHSRPVEDRSN